MIQSWSGWVCKRYCDHKIGYCRQKYSSNGNGAWVTEYVKTCCSEIQQGS